MDAIPDEDVNGRRPKPRFRDAIFAGPVRSLEQWGALTADDWDDAARIVDDNPRLNKQHVIEHLFWRKRQSPPVSGEPAAGVPDVPDVPSLPEPAAVVVEPLRVRFTLPALPDSNKRSNELPGPTPKRSRRQPDSLPALAAEVQLLGLQVRQMPDAVPRLTAEVQDLASQVRQVAAEVQQQLHALVVEPLPVAPEPVPLLLPLPVEPELGPVFIHENELAVEPEPEPAQEQEQEQEQEPGSAVVPEHLLEFVFAGHLPETYVLTPFPLWRLRHDDLAPNAWTSKVTAVVEAYGPFPDRAVIIVSIRYSFGRDLSKDQYDSDMQRCVEAASTLIRHIRSLPGQENRQFLIYPWIRSGISSTSNWFEKPFRLELFPRGAPRTTQSSCRLKELEFVLDNLAPDTQVWWLSIGIDALTTDIENLRRAQTRWPMPDFTLAVMVHTTFSPDVHQFGLEDMCPPRPAVSGMRIRIYSFARLLAGAHEDATARKLLAVWRHINDGKLSDVRRNYDNSLTVMRNRMPVSPAGLSGPSLWVDRV